MEGTSPARQLAATAYDSAHRQLVLFGGNGPQPTATPPTSLTLNTPALDTWVFDGTRWHRRSPAGHPPTTGPMVFDPSTGTVLLVANAIDTSALALAPPHRTWSWNGSSWRQLRPPAEIPRSMGAVRMVADLANHTLVAVAACCGQGAALQTWTWDGRTWSPHPSPTGLPAGLEFVMAYDPGSQRVLAVGNQGETGASATWAWNGTTWTPLEPASDALFDPLTAIMATDPTNGTVVLVATLDAVAHTGSWNGSSWLDTLATGPTGADTAYGDAAMYYDDAIGQLLLLSSRADDFSEGWMWTGTNWLQLPSPRPEKRAATTSRQFPCSTQPSWSPSAAPVLGNRQGGDHGDETQSPHQRPHHKVGREMADPSLGAQPSLKVRTASTMTVIGRFSANPRIQVGMVGTRQGDGRTALVTEPVEEAAGVASSRPTAVQISRPLSWFDDNGQVVMAPLVAGLRSAASRRSDRHPLRLRYCHG